MSESERERDKSNRNHKKSVEHEWESHLMA